MVIEQIKKNIPAAQIMLIIIWAAVHSVLVSGVIVSNSNSPYEQGLAGAVVVLLMLSVVGVVSTSGTTFQLGMQT